MLRLATQRLTPGMIVGRSIIDYKGRVLLTAGQVLNARYIRRIRELKLTTVYIEEDLGIADSMAAVSPVVISRATKTLKNTYKACSRTGKANLAPMQSQIDNIIDDLLVNSNILIGMSDIKSHDDYTYQHSVNVCVLSILLGISNGYNRTQLQTLGTGALLHDIGKINIPLEILNKPGSLTDEEYMIVQKHSLDGFKIIRDSSEIPLLAAHIALEHHERVDGKGYPRNLVQENIHEYGLIVAVADIFDALVSDRPYRRGFSNQDAMRIVEQNKNTQLAAKFVDMLYKHVNLYPPGTVVVLSTGDMAVVTQENHAESNPPQVKLLFNGDQQVYNRDIIIDLATDTDIYINSIQNPEDSEKNICLYLSLKNEQFPHCAGQ